jgi:glycosyltransferase involved in cell wall biosynthesis
MLQEHYMKLMISVIIPTKNSGDTLQKLLYSLENQTYRNFETIVVDNNSMDSTREIAERMHSIVVNFGPERSAQRNKGAEIAKGEALLFLDSDMELTEHILERCISGMSTSDALCIREKVVAGDNYWARARAFERDAYFGSLYFEAARCFRRTVFNKLGGYDASLTGLEDMALQAKLIEGGYRIGWIDDPILHHEEDVGFKEYMRKRRLYGSTDKQFRDKFPEYWRILRSPLLRSRVVLRHCARMSEPSALKYIPPIVLMRSAELIARRQ